MGTAADRRDLTRQCQLEPETRRKKSDPTRSLFSLLQLIGLSRYDEPVLVWPLVLMHPPFDWAVEIPSAGQEELDDVI